MAVNRERGCWPETLRLRGSPYRLTGERILVVAGLGGCDSGPGTSLLTWSPLHLARERRSRRARWLLHRGSGEFVRLGFVEPVSVKAVVVHRDGNLCAEEPGRYGSMLVVQGRGERAWRLAVWEADGRSVDRSQNCVERPVTVGCSPPVPVEHGVPEVDDALPVGLDGPGDVWVAQGVDGGTAAMVNGPMRVVCQ